MILEYKTTQDAQFLTVETIANRTEGLEVEYNGKEGTVIEGSEEDFRKILDNLGEIRDDIWEDIVECGSNRKATELDDKYKELRKVRNKLQKALSNPDYKWRQ